MQAVKAQFYSLLRHLHTLLDAHADLNEVHAAKEGLLRLNEAEGRFQELKQLATQLGSSGEGLDPGNTVGEDCKKVCDQVEQVKRSRKVQQQGKAGKQIKLDLPGIMPGRPDGWD